VAGPFLICFCQIFDLKWRFPATTKDCFVSGFIAIALDFISDSIAHAFDSMSALPRLLLTL
jgi:hypothetical protein